MSGPTTPTEGLAGLVRFDRWPGSSRTSRVRRSSSRTTSPSTSFTLSVGCSTRSASPLRTSAPGRRSCRPWARSSHLRARAEPVDALRRPRARPRRNRGPAETGGPPRRHPPGARSVRLQPPRLAQAVLGSRLPHRRPGQPEWVTTPEPLPLSATPSRRRLSAVPQRATAPEHVSFDAGEQPVPCCSRGRTWRRSETSPMTEQDPIEPLANEDDED